jgi:hypothetical protein
MHYIAAIYLTLSASTIKLPVEFAITSESCIKWILAG